MSLQDKLKNFAEVFDQQAKQLVEVLACYQPYEVTVDEINKAVDTLLTADEQWLDGSIDMVATFMPSNLPLYSLVLFGVMPALMAQEVHIKTNQIIQKFDLLNKLAEVLELKKHFPNIYWHQVNRSEFITKFVNKSDAIIFTGKPKNASKIIEGMKIGAIMIANCSGHNPLVITASADIDQAVCDAIHVRGYNCGQDCAGPDAILLHKNIAEEFIAKFTQAFTALKVGPYSDSSVKIGPIHSVDNLLQLSKFLYDNKSFIISNGYIDYKQSIVTPTVLHSNIKEKINYDEIFAPIAFLHTYSTDEELDLYFNDKEGIYLKNKMYVSLYGYSDYVMTKNDLVLPEHNGIGIVLNNQTIHHVENGNDPFGGYSSEGSCVIKKTAEKILRVAQPTLVPREIKRYLIEDEQLIPTKIVKHLHNASKQLDTFKNVMRTIFRDNLLFAYIWPDDIINRLSIFVCLDNQISFAAYQEAVAKLHAALANNHLLLDGTSVIVKLDDLDAGNLPMCRIGKILTGKKLGFIGDGRLLSKKIKQIQSGLNNEKTKYESKCNC